MNRWRLCAALLPACVGTPVALAGDVSVYGVATSDYVYRGATQSDGDPAIQLGADLSFENGLYAGAWASTVDLTSPITQRDVEMRLYVGYGFAAGPRTRVNLTAVAYRYPGSEGAVSYDNEEFGVSVSFDDTVWLEYAYSSDLYGSGWHTQNIELIGERPVMTNWMLSGGIGLYRVNNLADSDTAYWNVGLSRRFQNLEIDLRHHVANEAIPFISTSSSIGSRFSASIRYTF